MSFLIFIMSMATGTLIGYSLTLRDNNHLKALEKFSEIITRAEIYVSYNRLETDAIMDRLLKDNDKTVKLTESKELYFDGAACLDSTEKELVEEFNKILGSTNVEGQTALLESLKARLCINIEAFRGKISKKGGLYTTVGALLGTAFGIIMM